MAGGQLKIEVLPAGAVVKAFDLLDAVSAGTLDGGHDVNEVWLEDVRVPVSNLVGEENQGWTYAKYLLGHERTGIAGLGHCHRELGILQQMAARAQSHGKPLLADSRIRDPTTARRAPRPRC
ncbi:hypothetical protein G6F23_014865 [Rhizopus arrhizus]|nr:hypothetical protein G6F23_014865 [Rhizopus arrhizus]